MSDKSNNNGRAFEFITLNVLNEEINKIRKAKILHNSSYEAAQSAWNQIPEQLQNNLRLSAIAAVYTIFDMEPLILDIDDNIVELNIQVDDEGKKGDVRDILISRNNIQWVIGLSLKHNHFAVKHSRLSYKLDFGKEWFGVPCTKGYWESVTPVFNNLKKLKAEKIQFDELPEKEKIVYLPLLNAFMNEIKTQTAIDNTIPKKMITYLLGKFDFYKIISIDHKQLAQIEGFNIYGTLNKPSKTTKPKIIVPIIDLPTRIVSFDYKPKSSTTVELYMDNGWQFSFRIHNAEKIACPTLKFDIQIIGMPATIVNITSKWKNI